MNEAQLIKRLAIVEAHHRLAAEECYRLRTELERVDAPARPQGLAPEVRAKRQGKFRASLSKKPHA